MAPSVQNLVTDVALKEGINHSFIYSSYSFANDFLELKYNPELERMAIQWICDVLEMKPPSNATFAEFLKDGTHLCR